MNCSSDDKKDFFVLTGTGRCGTDLFARILSNSQGVECLHEKYFSHNAMKNFFSTNRDYSYLIQNLLQQLVPEIKKSQDRNVRLGVSSGHAYFFFPVLEKILQGRVKYVLLVRKPEEFIRSALARGFFDEDHPRYCEQIAPASGTEVAGRWGRMSPLEKCAWYWGLVNNEVLDFFAHVGSQRSKVMKIEELSLDTVQDLCSFLNIDISDNIIEECISKKFNASPGVSGAATVNPYSVAKSIPDISKWDAEWLGYLKKYTSSVATFLGYESR